jgi:hypothetical protein
VPSGLEFRTTFDTSDMQAAIDRLAGRANAAVEKATRRGIAFFVAAAMAHAPVAKSTAAVTDDSGTVVAPRHTGGTLRRSIHIVEVTQTGPGRWLATAGPSVIYGRFRDLGGTIVPKNVSMLRFAIDGQIVFAHSVTQKGSFYMEKGLDDLEGAIEGIFAAAWDEAMRA